MERVVQAVRLDDYPAFFRDRVLGDAAKLFKVGALWLPSAAYNFIGPRVVKRLVEAQAKRNAPKPEGPPPEPTLGQGFEDVPQGPGPARESPPARDRAPSRRSRCPPSPRASSRRVPCA